MTSIYRLTNKVLAQKWCNMGGWYPQAIFSTSQREDLYQFHTVSWSCLLLCYACANTHTFVWQTLMQRPCSTLVVTSYPSNILWDCVRWIVKVRQWEFFRRLQCDSAFWWDWRVKISLSSIPPFLSASFCPTGILFSSSNLNYWRETAS